METAAAAAPYDVAAADLPPVPPARGQVARLRPRGGFGGYLHELRRERGLTARQLATAAGVHHTYVSKLERGDRQAPEEPVVEALAAALGATPAQLDQLRWRAGLAPRGSGAPGQDDPTLTLVAEALGSPSLADTARDHLRQSIAQAVQQVGQPAPQTSPWASSPGPGPLPFIASGGHSPVSPAAEGFHGRNGWAGNTYPSPAPQAPIASTFPPVAAQTLVTPTAAPQAPILSPEAPPDPRAALMAGLAGSWQTVDEAAAELRVTGAYLLSLVQAGQLRAWMLPGGQPGSLAGLRVRREDLLGLLQPVRL